MDLFIIIKNIWLKTLATVMDKDLITMLNDQVNLTKIKVDKIFRLYYNKSTGEPISYTMEILEGDYVDITPLQYAQGDYNVSVINGKIKKPEDFVRYRKLIPTAYGKGCNKNNVMIVEPDSETRWSVKVYTIN